MSSTPVAKLTANGKYAYAVEDYNWFGNFAYGQTNGPWLYGKNWLSVRLHLPVHGP